MKNRILLFLILILGSLTTRSFGQASGIATGFSLEKSYPSPDVATLGTFGLIPANPFNGQSNVSVPLYTVSYKDLEIPISISYATGGIKPDDHPGWTGLGWGFQAGGMIYRKVNGLYDEYPPGEAPNMSGTFNLSYYDNCGRVTTNFNNQDTIMAYALTGNTNVLAYAFDGIPDEFVFNFNNYSGVFYITRPSINGPVELKVKPNGNYKLKAEILEIKDHIVFDDWINRTGNTFETRSTSRSIYKLKITDENGVQYIFGGTPAAIEFSNNGNFTKDFYTIASSWHLTEVIAPAGYKIQLTYKKKGRIIQQRKQRNATFYDVNFNFAGNALILFNSTSGSYSYSGTLESTGFSFQNPAWLDSIKTPLQTVTFTSSRSSELDYPFELDKLYPVTEPDYRFGAIANYWQKLDEINVAGSKIIRFNYRHLPTKRLRLDSIEIKTASLEKIMSYSFVYDSLSLPAYNARMADHWGYYNGRTYAYGNNYQTLREPVAQYMQAEMLKQINYPTGGYLKLEYEPHYYSKIAKQFPFTVETQTSNLMAGGLRIKKMTSTSKANDAPVIKEFFYITNYIGGGTGSSGVLAGVPQYVNTGSHRTSYRTGNFWAGSWGNLSLYYGSILDNNFLQLSTTNGNHITYSEVTERSGRGYTVYKFNNHDNGYPDKAPYVMYTNFDSRWHEEGFISMAPFRGLTASTTWYDESKRKVKNISSSYFIDTSANWKVPTFHRTGTTIAQVSLNRVSTCAFYIKPPLQRTIRETEYINATGDSLITVTNFRYYPDVYPSAAAANDNFKQAETNGINSKNETIKKISRYPAYMALNGTDPTGVYQEMVNNNIVAPIVEELSFKGTTQLELTRNNYYKPYTGVYVLKNTEIKPFSEPSEIRYQTYNYDTHGNVTEHSKTGDVHEVIIWGYQGQFPVAKIIGSSYGVATSYVSLSLLDNAKNYTDDQVRAELNKLRTNLPNALVTTYTYSPLNGMTSETSPQGYTKYYEYDGAGRLRVIRDQDRNVIKKICYSYAGQQINCDGTVYYSRALSKSFIKQGCTGCTIGTSVTYNVTAKKYFSEISQADADAKAQADMDVNGQNYANTNGTCYQPPIFVKTILTNFEGDAASIRTADLVFQFFSDTNYTVPYSVTNLSVNYNVTTNNCGSNPTTTSTNQTIICNGTEHRINVSIAWDIEDGIHCWNKTYTLLPGSCYYDRVYYNTSRSQVFTRNNCAAGYTGTPVTYSVPAGRYRSVISQADADAKAIAEINANGQNYANANGSCVFYNVAVSQSFTRNNCPAPQIGGTVTYTVPAKRYSSTISQADADAKAQADINANGQNYANVNGTCTNPGYPYVKMSLTNYVDDGETVTATLLFQFYSNAAKTIPMSVSNLTVNYNQTTTQCSGSSSTSGLTIACNGTSTSRSVQVSFDLGDGRHCWNRSFSLQPGTGYYR